MDDASKHSNNSPPAPRGQAYSRFLSPYLRQTGDAPADKTRDSMGEDRRLSRPLIPTCSENKAVPAPSSPLKHKANRLEQPVSKSKRETDKRELSPTPRKTHEKAISARHRSRSPLRHEGRSSENNFSLSPLLSSRGRDPLRLSRSPASPTPSSSFRIRPPITDHRSKRITQSTDRLQENSKKDDLFPSNNTGRKRDRYRPPSRPFAPGNTPSSRGCPNTDTWRPEPRSPPKGRQTIDRYVPSSRLPSKAILRQPLLPPAPLPLPLPPVHRTTLPKHSPPTSEALQPSPRHNHENGRLTPIDWSSFEGDNAPNTTSAPKPKPKPAWEDLAREYMNRAAREAARRNRPRTLIDLTANETSHRREERGPR